MRKLTVLFIGIFAVAMFSCTNSKQKQNEENVTPDMHTSEMALDYTGVYEGVMPCADCEGIKTQLTINDDNTFVLISEYLGKEDATFEERGNYFIENGETLVIQDEDGDQKYFKLQENSLAQLDADMKVIEGELAEYYILTKK